MRATKLLVLLGVALAIGLGGPQTGRGQNSVAPIGRPALFGTNFSASDIQNVPIDTSKAVAPVPGIQQGPLSNFNMSSVLSFITFGGAKSTIGTSPLPSPTTFPSTKYPNTFKPLPPINS